MLQKLNIEYLEMEGVLMSPLFHFARIYYCILFILIGFTTSQYRKCPSAFCMKLRAWRKPRHLEMCGGHDRARGGVPAAVQGHGHRVHDRCAGLWEKHGYDSSGGWAASNWATVSIMTHISKLGGDCCTQIHSPVYITSFVC
jgi:hypothetical protein